MRSFACALVLLSCLAGVAVSDDDDASSDDASTSTETVTIDGAELTMSYEAEADGESIREFIPSDESLETWTRLAAIREYPELNDPTAVAEAVTKKLDDSDPPIHYDLLENSKTGESVLDFTVFPEDKSFAEFNVFCYRKQADGGLASYQYAVRAYGDDVVDFVNGLDAEKRMKYIVATLQFAAEQNGEEPKSQEGGAQQEATGTPERDSEENE
jgi:hypothetical protein